MNTNMNINMNSQLVMLMDLQSCHQLLELPLCLGSAFILIALLRRRSGNVSSAVANIVVVNFVVVAVVIIDF